MNRLLAAAALVALSIAPTPAHASSAGGALYRPQPLSTTQHGCSTHGCGPGSLCQACDALRCVDPATPSPCSADGVCKPKTETFGFYQTRWRRWPTDIDAGKPTEAPSDEDSLLGPIDPPLPTEEDQQAPPPIEDPVAEEEEPSLEIELPATPLPTELPGQLPAAQPPAEDGPPLLPFGSVEPRLPESAPRRQLPTAKVAGFAAKPSSRVRHAGFDGPPALPESFASARGPAGLVRLPAIPGTNRDRAVTPASYRTAAQPAK